MAIGTVVQSGDTLYVYNDKSVKIGMYFGELRGHTRSTINIQRGNIVYTYDERGMPISTEFADQISN
jgi:hypothetical protein